MIIYEVVGDPVPWAAPKRNGNRYYDPKFKEKQRIIWQLKSQFNHEMLTGALKVTICSYVKIPKSISSIKRRQMLHDVIKPICKPDRTNLGKLVEDCLQYAGIIKNDSQIVDGEVQKKYGLVPKTIIKIEPYYESEKVSRENIS